MITALNWGTGFFAAGLVVFGVLAFAGENNHTRFLQSVGVLIPISLVVAGMTYLSLPRIEVKLVRGQVGGNWVEQKLLLRMVLDDFEPRNAKEARKELQRIVSSPTNATPYYSKSWDNLLVGGEVREEDSPGNYLLRETNNQLQFVTFDVNGREEASGTWNLVSPR